MPIEIQCTNCSKRLRVPDNAAGKRVKCPGCQTVLSVPAAGGNIASGSSTSARGGSTAAAKIEKYHLKTEDGQTYGPVPKAELDEWFAEGRITAECQLLVDGGDQWQWATDIYPQLAAEEQSAPAESDNPFANLGGGAGGGASDNPYHFSSPSSSRSGGTTSSSSNPGDKKHAAKKVSLPAILMMVSAVLSILVLILDLVIRASGIGLAGLGLEGVDPDVAMGAAVGNSVAMVFDVIALGINGFIIFAAMQMQKLRGWGMSMTGAVLSVVPCFACCFLLAMPVGIWSIVVLNSADVKSAFRK